MKTLKDSIKNVVMRYKKVPERLVTKIIEDYQDSLQKTLVEYGYVYVTPEIKIEVVPITPRRYVLRGTEYRSNRLYKIKATIAQDLYEDIADVYDQLREDI